MQLQKRVVRAAAMAVTSVLVAGAAWAAAPDSRVAAAMQRRDGRGAAALIRQKADVNGPLPDGATALHWAAHWDDLASAELLLTAGARIAAVNEYGVMPLYLAAANGSGPMVARLLKAGASANSALPTGETVLMAAARSGTAAAVAALLEKGADPNASQASKGQTALMWAISEQHIEVVRLLLDKGADLHAKTALGFTPLMFAAREPGLEIVKLLVERGARLDESATDGSTPLLVATVRGHVATATFLLDRGAKPDGNLAVAGFAPLHWAAGKAESIITYDYPAAPGEWAAAGGIPTRAAQLDLVKALLAKGATVDAPATKAIPRFGYYLFGIGRNGFDIGATPFLLAAMVADIDVMKMLLASGADPRKTTTNKTTALMMAAGIGYQDQESRIPQSDYLAATQFILDLNVSDLNAANTEGFTVTHVAAWAGFETVIDRLVVKGAPLNPKNKRGETPLDITEGYHFSFYFDRPAAAALLHKLGAVGGVERGGLLAGQTKKDEVEQYKSKQQPTGAPTQK